MVRSRLTLPNEELPEEALEVRIVRLVVDRSERQ